MHFEDVQAMSLGVKEKGPGKYNGEETSGYYRLAFVFKGEDNVKKLYFSYDSDWNIKSQIVKVGADKWGTPFLFSGEVNTERGRVESMDDIKELNADV